MFRRAEPPLQTWQWDEAARRWRSTPTLSARRKEKWHEIKAERARRIAACGAAAEPALDASPEGLANITSVATALMSAPSLASMRFTCADNVRREFDRDTFLAMARSVLAAVQGVYDTADELRAAIGRSDAAALAFIQWPA